MEPMNRNFLFCVLMLICTVFHVNSQSFVKSVNKIELQDGDTFVFIGNSITHQCEYTQFIEDFFYTRFPNQKINFINAGVSGDFARDVLNRIEKDILVHRPRYASILIGMNDGMYVNWQDSIFNAYKADMTVLMNTLDEHDVRPIMLTPTIYDTQQGLIGENWVDKDIVPNLHYDAVLAFFGAWVAEAAGLRGYGYADLHGDLTRFTRKAREKEGDFTFVPDAVHPESDGQFIMALSFLKGIEVDPYISEVVVDQQNGEWIYEARNATLSNRQKTKISFDLKAQALPWVVPENARYAFDLTEASSMTKEVVCVYGLTHGTYDLIIEGNVVGQYTHRDFARGVEIQQNQKTPQYQQSQRVAALNQERNEEIVQKIRDLWLLQKELSDPEFEEDEKVDEELLEEDPDYRLYIQALEMGYERFMSEIFYQRIDSLMELSQTKVDEIYRQNKPQTYRYEIRKTE